MNLPWATLYGGNIGKIGEFPLTFSSFLFSITLIYLVGAVVDYKTFWNPPADTPGNPLYCFDRLLMASYWALLTWLSI